MAKRNNYVGEKHVQYYCDYCKGLINLKEEDLYNYKRKFFHMDCLTLKLKRARKVKYSLEEIKEVLKEAKAAGKITIKNEHQQKPKKKQNVVKLPKLTQDKSDKDLQKLLDFIVNKYSILTETNERLVENTIKSINKGTYKKCNGTKIPYEDMYKMFIYYEQTLNYIHSRLKTKIENGVPLLFYDIAILINKYPEYLDDISHSQVNENPEETFEVSNYLKGRNIDEEDNNDDIDIEAFLEGY